MKKHALRLLALVLALSMIFGCIGCSRGTETESSTSELSSSSETESSSSEGESTSESASEAASDTPASSASSTAASGSSATGAPGSIENISLSSKLKQGISRNSDTVAWLKVPGTTIDDAVIQYSDNDYYLRLDEDKNYDVFGCYMADYNCFLDQNRSGLSRNTIIYGHSDYKDNPNGKRFSQLFNYTDLNFLKSNPYIYMATEKEELVWQVFAVFYTNINFNYIQANPTADVMAEIVKEAKSRSEYIIDLDVTSSDKVLTLSTCTKYYNEANYENYRFVVMAKLLPAGASGTCTTAMSVNPSPKKS
jgi:sortase B